MNGKKNRDSDKTIGHETSDKTIGHDSDALRPDGSVPPADVSGKRQPLTPPGERTVGPDATLMFSGSGDADTSGSETGPAGIPDVAGYEILEELGRGGMGVVYKARNRKLNRIVALKMILAGAHASKESILRFRSEAEAVAQIQHPNIVQVYDVGQSEGRPWCSLEFVEGGSLDDLLNQGRTFTQREAAEFVETVARAMQAAHATGIVHRDLKPANILLTVPSGSSLDVRSESLELIPKVTDFGLAKRVEQEASQTQTGAIVGTPSYMAPEQARGIARIGPAADIFALGAILYRLLTGRPPFVAETPIKTVMQVINEEPPQPGTLVTGLDRDVTTICMKCLDKDPTRRYASAEHLAQDLNRYLTGVPIQARPVSTPERVIKWVRRKPWAAAVIALTVLGLTGAIIGGAIFNSQLSEAYDELSRQKDVVDSALQAENVAKEAALEASEEARRNAEESQRRLIDNYVSNGLREMENGDPLHALPWFAEARNLEPDQARARNHAVRFESALQASPEVAETWLTDAQVRFVRFSPDSERVVMVSGNQRLSVFELPGRTQTLDKLVDGQIRLAQTDQGCEKIGTVSIQLDESSADFRTQVIRVEVWDIATGERIGIPVTLPLASLEDQDVHALSVEAMQLAILDPESDHRAQLIDLHTGDVAAVLDARSPIQDLNYSPDGRHLVVRTESLNVFNLADQNLMIEAPIEDFGQLAVSNLGVVWTDGAEANFVPFAEGSEVAGDLSQADGDLGQVEIPLESSPRMLAMADDGSVFAVVNSHGLVSIYTTNGKLARSVDVRARLNLVTFGTRGRFLLLASNQMVWRVDARDPKATPIEMTALHSPINGIAITSSGTEVAVASGRGIFDGAGALRVWRLEPSARPVLESLPVRGTGYLFTHDSDTRRLSLWERGSRRVAVTGALSATLTSTDSEARQLEIPETIPGGIRNVWFLRDPDRLLVVLDSGKALVFSISGERFIREFPLVNDLSFAMITDDRSKLVVEGASGDSSDQREMLAYDIGSGTRLGRLSERLASVFDAGLASDDRTVVLAARDLTVQGWRLDEERIAWNASPELLVSTIDVDHATDLIAIAGERLGGKPGRVVFYDMANGETRFDPMELDDKPAKVIVSEASDRIWIALSNGSLVARSLTRGALIGDPVNHPDSIDAMQLDLEAGVLVTLCRDQKLRLFDPITMDLLTVFDTRGLDVRAVELITDSADGQLNLLLAGAVVRSQPFPKGATAVSTATQIALWTAGQSVSSSGTMVAAAHDQLVALAESEGIGIVLKGVFGGDEAESSEPLDVTENVPTTSEATASETTEAPSGLTGSVSESFLRKFPDLTAPQPTDEPITTAFHEQPQALIYRQTNRTNLDTLGVQSTQTETNVLRFSIGADSNGDLRVTSSYDAMRAQLRTPGGSFLYDSENPEKTAAAPVFRIMVDLQKIVAETPADFRIKTTGEVVDYHPPKAIEDAVALRPEAEGMSLTAKTLSLNYTAMLVSLPEDPVQTGDTWDYVVPASMFDESDVDAEATLLGVAEIDGVTCAVIKVLARAEGRPFQTDMFLGMQSTSESIVYFDIDAGCVHSSYTSAEGQMQMRINGAAITQKISSRTDIQRQ